MTTAHRCSPNLNAGAAAIRASYLAREYPDWDIHYLYRCRRPVPLDVVEGAGATGAANPGGTGDEDDEPGAVAHGSSAPKAR